MTLRVRFTSRFADKMVKASDGTLCPGITGFNVAMNYFAFFLSRGMDRGVIDKTGLPGGYDVNMQYVPEGASVLSPDCSDFFPRYPNGSA